MPASIRQLEKKLKLTTKILQVAVYKVVDQMHQKIASTSRDISSEEQGTKSKADDNVDQGKQEMHRFKVSLNDIGFGKD